jgi:SHAQKYF class myb-like DNA-binding protein
MHILSATMIHTNDNHHHQQQQHSSREQQQLVLLEPMVIIQPPNMNGVLFGGNGTPTPRSTPIDQREFIFKEYSVIEASSTIPASSFNRQMQQHQQPLPSFKEIAKQVEEEEQRRMKVIHTSESTSPTVSQQFEKSSEPSSATSSSSSPSFISSSHRHSPYGDMSSGSRRNSSSSSPNQRDTRYNHGRWTAEEHEQFVLGFQTCGRDWSRIAREFVTTRMRSQVASHAQKYLMKIEGDRSSDVFSMSLN